MIRTRMILVLVAAMAYFTPAYAGTYRIDEDHTSISFSVKHMMIFDVKGHFGLFSGTFDFDEDKALFTSAKADIFTETINTGSEKRDKVLRSEDFFDVKKYPDIYFTLKRSKSPGGNHIHAVGDITIRGITREVALDGEYRGSVVDFEGNKRVGFTAKGVLKRGDFGMLWNEPLKSGGYLVGEDVNISLEIEGIKNK